MTDQRDTQDRPEEDAPQSREGGEGTDANQAPAEEESGAGYGNHAGEDDVEG